jgi:UDP-N-acetylglucosamine/UDP-N-acetylgalactosamine diphosphorylase
VTLSLDQARQRLQEHGQAHVLAFWEQLDDAQKTRLLEQVEALDFRALSRMRELLGGAEDGEREPSIVPADVVTLSGTERASMTRAGEEALRRGEVGVLLVAGGQGTRLGFDGPKGCFPIGPVSGAPLFQLHARKILALEQKYECRVPFYVMTSLANDAATREFFDTRDYFGLSGNRVTFFTQGMWPALTPAGGLVLDRPDHIFMSPDGHGGLIAALDARGMLDDMEQRGLRTLFYLQVDNPLVEIADPPFVGLHRAREADVSVKVCAKRDPEEGLGVVVKRDGADAIVEYTELTDEQKRATAPDGTLRFRFGSVAIHVFALDFLRRMTTVDLPLHMAHKKVPTCDGDGKTVTPGKPNAYKFEKFVFDVLPHAKRVLNLEFAREEEFSPVKNASGADSPDTARRDMILKACRRLEQAGAAVPRDRTGLPLHKVEIDACYASGPDDLRARLGNAFRVTQDLLLAPASANGT